MSFQSSPSAPQSQPEPMDPVIDSPQNNADGGETEAPRSTPELQEDLAADTLDYTYLGIELRNAIEAGQMKPEDIRMWTARPWLAYSFLVAKLDKNKNVATTPVFDGLREWNFAGAAKAQDSMTQEQAHEAWAKDHPELAQKLTIFVRTVSERLDGRMRTYEKVQSQLSEQKEIATTDRLFSKASEMIHKHPGLSVAAVFAGAWVLWKGWKSENGFVRGAAKLTTFAAMTVGLYGAGRKYLGMEPLEWIADSTEGLIGKGAADSLRSFSDTLTRGPKLASGRDFSVLNFFQDKFGINGMDEKAFFNSLCEENPREFLQWYNNVRTWKLTRQGGVPSMPPHLQETFRKQVRLGLVPQAVARKSKEDQANALLNVAEKTMHSFKNDPDANGMDPVAFLQERYVTGDYFTRIYEEWSKEWVAKHGAAGNNVLKSAKEYAENMRSQIAQSNIKMLDIFMIHMTEKDAEKAATYGPGGKSLKDIYDGIALMASRTGELAYEGLGRAVNFATMDVPETAKKLYEYYQNGYSEEFRRLGITQESVGAWINEFSDGVQRQAAAVQSGAQDMYEFASNSPMWKFLEENLGIYGRRVGSMILFPEDRIAEIGGIISRAWNAIFRRGGGQEASLPASAEEIAPSPSEPEEAPPPAENEEVLPPANEATPFPGSDERPFPSV